MPAPGFESCGQLASYHVDKESSVGDKTRGYQGPDTNLEDLEWREIKGPFVSVWLHNVPWGAENTLAAPNAKVGQLHILKSRSLHSVVYCQNKTC